MVTQFDSREASRDGLVALFVAEGSWQKVFPYQPTAKEIDNQWPLMIINSVSTLQDMPSESLNPTTFTFIVTSFVATQDNVAWETPDAADLVDELDQTTRQIVRDNTTAGTFADGINFVATPSNVSIIELHHVNYLAEMRLIEVHLYSGQRIP